MSGARPVFADAALQAALERDGYVVVDLFDADDLARLAALHEAERVHLQDRFHLTILSPDPSYRRRVDEGIGAIVRPRLRRVTGHEVTYSGFVVKQPDPTTLMGFHQDWSLVDESRHSGVTFWAPVCDVEMGNGCLLVVPGSHRLNPQPRGFNTIFPYEELVPALLRRHTKAVPMKAGQAMFFLSSLFHASNPNFSDRERVCITSVLVPPEADLLFHYESGGDAEEPARLETFAVDRDFYVKYPWGDRPDPRQRIAVSQPHFDAVGLSDLERLPEQC